MTKKQKLPELLAPAGTPQALRAAIEAGADAVYLGGTAFNARLRAENFTPENIKENIALCHTYGVRVYVTLNTLVTDKELPLLLQAAKEAHEAGADALIVADLGAAVAIHRTMPEIELHASTQSSGHSLGAAKKLADLGFSRMVLAREATAENMQRVVRESPIETEVFVHGALCVSHSGQCLFSSLVGGRSGNRGECAQPCRLPDKNGKYPLSLKDLSLARHVPALIEMGVHSLKIEGRLKSPEYVRDVVRIWRRLLDERRAATDAEMRELAAIFSRDGFTDAYFTDSISGKMLGIRSEQDKQSSGKAAPFLDITRKIPLSLSFRAKADTPTTLTLKTDTAAVTVAGDVPMLAKTAPMDAAAFEKSLCKLGGTPFAVKHTDVVVDDGLMLPISRINDLRRRALAALTAQKITPLSAKEYIPQKPTGTPPAKPTARFEHAADIPNEALAFFEHIYLPLTAFAPPANGVVLPPVVFDSEVESVRTLLQNAVRNGAKHALVGNLGHLALATEAGLVPHGDFRLNVTNREALAYLLSLGFADVLLSPELTLPQIRDIHGARDAIVYGRIPLMTLEKCVGKELGDCHACERGTLMLTDRRGEKFPVLRTFRHRSIIVNSRPTVMSDKKAALASAKILGGHFIFTTESKSEIAKIIKDYQTGAAPTQPVRRI